MVCSNISCEEWGKHLTFLNFHSLYHWGHSTDKRYFFSSAPHLNAHQSAIHLDMFLICKRLQIRWRVEPCQQSVHTMAHMMTSSNGNIFRVTGHLCGEFTGPRWIPAPRPVTLSFDVFFDLRPNKRLSKQWWGWWFETPSSPLWRHCNEIWQSSTCSDDFHFSPSAKKP